MTRSQLQVYLSRMIGVPAKELAREVPRAAGSFVWIKRKLNRG